VNGKCAKTIRTRSYFVSSIVFEIFGEIRMLFLQLSADAYANVLRMV
jgi:hypothetical protein